MIVCRAAHAFALCDGVLDSAIARRKPELGKGAVSKLQDTLAIVFEKLPVKPRGALATVNFHLMWGKDSPLGGRASGMSYIRKGEPKNYPHLDPRWEHSIVVFSADNLIHLNELWARKDADERAGARLAHYSLAGQASSDLRRMAGIARQATLPERERLQWQDTADGLRRQKPTLIFRGTVGDLLCG